MNKTTIEMYLGSPLYQAFFPMGIETHGMGQAIIARKTAGGAIVTGVFLCDHFCLGVKNCFVTMDAPPAYQALMQRMHETETLVEKPAEYVKQYIVSLVAWAKDIGFMPHSDYRFCAGILRGIPADTTATFTFGMNGTPHYIAGPHDSPSMIQATIRTLEAYKARTGSEAHYTVPFM